MLPLDFTEDGIIWIVLKLSAGAGSLGADDIELSNWIIRFGSASEEFRINVAKLSYWMVSSSSPWAAYLTLMACCIVALDKRLVVRYVRIG